MAIAHMSKLSNKITAIDVHSDIKELQEYLKNLKGRKILALEETTTSQWLYTELRDYVDKIVICDPHRNKLLNEGAKTDKIDACKLVQLLKVRAHERSISLTPDLLLASFPVRPGFDSINYNIRELSKIWLCRYGEKVRVTLAIATTKPFY